MVRVLLVMIAMMAMAFLSSFATFILLVFPVGLILFALIALRDPDRKVNSGSWSGAWMIPLFLVLCLFPIPSARMMFLGPPALRQPAVPAFLASIAAFAAVVLLTKRILVALRALVGPDRMLPFSASKNEFMANVFMLLPAIASATTVFLGPPYSIAAAVGATAAASSAIGLLTAHLMVGAIREGRKEFYVEGGAAYRRRRRRGRGELLRVARTLTSVGDGRTGPALGRSVYSFVLVLADGGSAVNLYVDEATRDRDLAALAIPSSYRTSGASLKRQPSSTALPEAGPRT